MTRPILSATLILAFAGAGIPPTADSILQKYIDAAGGKEAHDRIRNRVTRARLEMLKQGIQASVVIHHARPNRMYTVIESDALGKIEKGTDGKVYWERSVISGPVVKEGQEKEDLLRETIFDKLISWKETYAKASYLGEETIGEIPCHTVQLTPRTGEPLTYYFGKETGLPYLVKSTLESAMGTIPLETRLGDYREVDGIRIPFEARISVLGQERVLTTESVEQNVDLPEDLFDLPQDIREAQNPLHRQK